MRYHYYNSYRPQIHITFIRQLQRSWCKSCWGVTDSQRGMLGSTRRRSRTSGVGRKVATALYDSYREVGVLAVSLPPRRPKRSRRGLGSPNPAEIATDEKDSQPSAMKQTWCPVRHEIPRFRGGGKSCPPSDYADSRGGKCSYRSRHSTSPHPTPFSPCSKGRGVWVQEPTFLQPKGGVVQESALHVHLRGSLLRKGDTQKS